MIENILKPKAIVLGGTSPHIELIEILKKRGYYTVLVDYYNNPPAKNVADEHIQESTLDQDKVLQIAKNIEAKLVISACVDQANVTACYVAEKIGLPAPYSYETALNVSNKGLMKKLMFSAGIPTAKFAIVTKPIEFDSLSLKFPVMVKPSDSCGSAGVKKAKNYSEYIEYIGEALKISRSNTAIVEEYKEGVEVSIYSYVQNKKSSIIMIAQRHSVIDGDNEVLKCYATTAPAIISSKMKDKINFKRNSGARKQSN